MAKYKKTEVKDKKALTILNEIFRKMVKKFADGNKREFSRQLNIAQEQVHYFIKNNPPSWKNFVKFAENYYNITLQEEDDGFTIKLKTK